jgi:Protein of unknown function (DUF3616)
MPAPSTKTGSIRFEFDEDQLIVGKDTDIRNQLSAVAAHGKHLFLACDEGCRLERLSRTSDTAFSKHKVFPLDTLLTLPAPAKEEADIEGMDVDDDFLWIVGSHSVKRKKPKGESPSEIAAKILETTRDGNRHILARIPLTAKGPRRSDDERQAAALAATTTSSALLKAIRSANDPHLAKFLDVPGKDNGFDFEGLAARGMRVWVGLRGPVLREWSCVLELHLEAEGERLKLRSEDQSSYKKHFLKLNGLGVRDLVVLGDDLLILAGVSMAHDGPSEIWRWKGGAKSGAAADPKKITRVLSLPQLEGEDRPEGLSVLEEGSASTTLMVVFDAPSNARKPDATTVLADLYRLP